MENMAGKISELLSDPEGMEKIKSMANMLFSESNASDNNNNDSNQSKSQSALPQNELSLPEGIDITKIMSVLSLLNNNKNDKRTGLLFALKPHLTDERQQRIDKAVKLLRIISVIPLLKEQGLLELF